MVSAVTIGECSHSPVAATWPGCLEDVDTTWEDLGYNSRSEFVRDVLRDTIKHLDFSRADLKAVLASEVEIQEGRTRASDEVTETRESVGDGE